MQTKALDTPTRLAPADVVRAAFAAYNRRAFDEGKRYLAPDLEWLMPSGLHGDVVHGPEALVRVLESELEAFSDISREPGEMQEEGERVLAVLTSRVRGRASGIELENRSRHAFTVRGGQIVRAEPVA